MILSSAPASAQDLQPLVGQWRGDVTETIDGDTERYRMFVSIDADRHGRLVGSVSYNLECRGIWTGAEMRGPIWHFDETITAGRTNCASHVEVDISREGDGLRVRLRPVGEPEQLARAVLRRSPPDPASAMLSAVVPGNAQLPLVTFMVPGRQEGPIMLPESAVLSDSRGIFVYIIDQNDAVERRDVVTGPISDRGGIPITRGLEGDERVVREAGPFLNPGEIVRPERVQH